MLKDYGIIKKLLLWKNKLRTKIFLTKNIDDKEFRSKLMEYNTQRQLGCDTTICHVPMRSIYFGFGGVVTACCFNRKYILGRFPENTIEEIIHGEQRKILQQHLSKTDFSLGCDYCKNMISAGNYMSVGARFADGFPDKGDYPSEMVFELDNTCNLQCEMCNARFSSSHNDGKRIVAPYDTNEFIEQLKPFIPHLAKTRFLGGEPFLSDIYPKIWELIIEFNPKCKISLQSNGTILKEKIKSILQRGNFHIGLSIDTLNPNRYEKIRSGAKIEKTLENLEFFNTICHKNGDKMNISVCPMKENRFDIPELVKFCNDNDILIYFNNVRTEGFSLGELSDYELDELVTFYKGNIPKANNSTSSYNSVAFLNLIRKVEHIKKESRPKDFMDEMVMCTRKEFVEIISTIISGDESIDINEAKSLENYIPETFNIKRSEYLYIKNEMKIDSIKSFLCLTKRKQMEHLNKILHI